MWCLLELLCRDWIIWTELCPSSSSLVSIWKNLNMFKEAAVCKATLDYYIIAFPDLFVLSVWSGLGWRCRSISHTSRLGNEFFCTFVYKYRYILYDYTDYTWLLFQKHVAAKTWNSKLEVSAKQGIAGFIGCKAKRTRLRMASFWLVAFVTNIKMCRLMATPWKSRHSRHEMMSLKKLLGHGTRLAMSWRWCLDAFLVTRRRGWL